MERLDNSARHFSLTEVRSRMKNARSAFESGPDEAGLFIADLDIIEESNTLESFTARLNRSSSIFNFNSNLFSA